MFEPDQVQFGLARDVSAPSKGRGAVGSLLGHDVPSPFVSDAMLATSELVTNALVHAHGNLEVAARFDRERGLLRVEVSDSSVNVPRPMEQVGDEVGGFGLQLVANMASAWGCMLNEHGKTMWFELMS
jgi:anti-sigma regulatory factor (Ser/Thr protein kinase)